MVRHLAVVRHQVVLGCFFKLAGSFCGCWCGKSPVCGVYIRAPAFGNFHLGMVFMLLPMSSKESPLLLEDIAGRRQTFDFQHSEGVYTLLGRGLLSCPPVLCRHHSVWGAGKCLYVEKSVLPPTGDGLRKNCSVSEVPYSEIHVRGA